MSGKVSNQIGRSAERRVIRLHQEMGITAIKVPGSGGAGSPGRRGGAGDVRLNLQAGRVLRAEVKYRQDGRGFGTDGKWMGDLDLLFLMVHHRPPWVLLPWTVYQELMTGRVVPATPPPSPSVQSGSSSPSRTGQAGPIHGPGPHLPVPV